jgi:hypothetical protein
MRRVFKTRQFSRWSKKTDLHDCVLCEAVNEMVSGLVDGDLGGFVLKKRVPMPGRGKSSGARVLVATRKIDRWFFLYGFEKNEKANIASHELEAFQILATSLLDLSTPQLQYALKDGTLQEICHEH